MIEQVRPEAYFDTLSIGHKLDTQLDGGFKQEEVHLFSYFSSILFLFKEKPLADWAYQYQIDANGYPFSMEIAKAIERDVQNVLFEEKDEYLVMTARGVDQLNVLRRQAQHQAERESMLNLIGQQIQSADSVEAVLQITARELSHALHSKDTRVILRDIASATPRQINS
jgi:hypothetical protein